MESRDLWLWYATMVDEKNGVTLTSFDSSIKIEEIYKSDWKTLTEEYGYTNEQADTIISSKQNAKLEKCKKHMENNGINFVTIEDADYPKRLRIYDDKPKYLFYRGCLPIDYLPTVGMVGARACTNYGRNIAKSIARELSNNHVQIISGMARGIDTYSQLGAIEGETPTFAVLGCGVDVCYPTENIELYENIIKKGGGIISEYAPGAAPLQWHFPLRNRIISGFSDQIAVIEAREKSGSLITVEYGLEQGKDIWAVPGRIGDPLSGGCNRLIKAGAGMLTSGYDILESFRSDIFDISVLEEGLDRKASTLDEATIKLFRYIDSYPKSINDICELAEMSPCELTGRLFELQLAGLIEEVSKNYYVRC